VPDILGQACLPGVESNLVVFGITNYIYIKSLQSASGPKNTEARQISRFHNKEPLAEMSPRQRHDRAAVGLAVLLSAVFVIRITRNICIRRCRQPEFIPGWSINIQLSRLQPSSLSSKDHL